MHVFFKGFRPSKNLYVFLFCFFLSTIFWFLNAFTNSYETIILLPVKYQDLPENKVILNELPKNLSLQVKSFGFTLIMRKFLMREDTIIISPSILQDKNYGKKELSFFTTRSILDKIVLQIGDDIQITNIITDTIYFEFNKRITKLVTVIPDVEYSFEKQYQQNGSIEITPNIVRISGPISHLDTLEFIYTKHKKYDKLSESISEEVELELPGNDNYYDVLPKSVNLNIPVEEYTEIVLSVPIVFENSLDSLSIKLFPADVKLVCTIPFSKYEIVSADLFKATVVLTNQMRLKVNIVKKPDYVLISEIQPERVEYILRK